MASWLDARAHQGTWLIRMEDVDAPRVVPGAAQRMLDTLARFGLVSDEAVLYQSTRAAAYTCALHALRQQGRVYGCRCSREERSTAAPCPCRALQLDEPDCAWRLHIEEAEIAFEDGLQGECRFDAARLGDPILYRRDGQPAYQLTVSVDDAFQGITAVVRGADLLESTAWQIAVLGALGAPVPRYTHVPLLTEPGGAKLAKSRRSLPLESLEPGLALAETLTFLGLHLPVQLKAAPVSDMLHWSVQNWCPVRIRGTRTIALRN